MNCAEIIRQSELIVIKIGSVLVTDESKEKVRLPWIESLAQDVKDWQAQGKKVVIVSSGAIALGRSALRHLEINAAVENSVRAEAGGVCGRAVSSVRRLLPDILGAWVCRPRRFC
jgi:glutamate 5-kinase